MNEVSLANKVAIVTGGGRGIGEAIARRLATAGAAVAIAELDPSSGASVANALEAEGARAIYIRTDVSDDASTLRCVEIAVQRFGGLDILVNNVGISIPKSVEDTMPDEWDHILDTNLRSCYLMSHHGIPLMRQRGGGAIIHIASWHAHATIERYSSYAASKGAIEALTRQMAIDCGPANIRVNAVSPGIIDTPMWRGFLESLGALRSATESEVLRLQPLGRIGTGQDVANAVLFLASDQASYVSGACLYVDGGASARLSHI
jgi:NAD(P)-dependent dehydrogenase (short-subunit alcohol dehydrogenase family)